MPDDAGRSAGAGGGNPRCPPLLERCTNRSWKPKGIPSPFLLPLGIVIASRWKNLTGRRPAPGPGNVVRRFLSPVVCAE